MELPLVLDDDRFIVALIHEYSKPQGADGRVLDGPPVEEL
jgi:hypothetical protein